MGLLVLGWGCLGRWRGRGEGSIQNAWYVLLLGRFLWSVLSVFVRRYVYYQESKTTYQPTYQAGAQRGTRVIVYR